MKKLDVPYKFIFLISFIIVVLGTLIIFTYTKTVSVDCEMIFPYPPTYECREAYYEHYNSLLADIQEIEVELYYLKRKASIMRVDMNATENNLTVQYINLDNEWIVRVQYDSQFFDNSTVHAIVEDVEVKYK